MSKRDYQRLDIKDFGRQLITSGDLDPVYIALHRMELETPRLHRWLIAYWCLYHCGAACWLSEHTGATFWIRLRDAAANTSPAPTGERWPRGHERRHFRGLAAVNAVHSLYERYGSNPERMVEYIKTRAPEKTKTVGLNNPHEFIDVSERAREHPLFGPWIAFKIADMIDRVLGDPVDFDQADVFMFADPRKAALMLWRRHNSFPETAVPRPGMETEIIRQVIAHLTGVFSDLTAPPLHDRPIGLQEVETVLCKWKSHMNGHYPLNNDIDEIVAGLMAGWTDCSDTAKAMKWAMPPRGPDGSR